jgi:opacity protein-like surface antigen
MKRSLIVSLLFILVLCSNVFGAHPLITDDAGTQGRGKGQAEISGQYSHEKDDGVTQKSAQANVSLTYGVIDNVDIVVGMPYQWVRGTDEVSATEHHGIGDASLAVKWKFFETDGWSFAIKPGVTFPTGDSDKGLGSARFTGSAFFIVTKELKPFAFHLNGGYIYNNNRIEQRLHIWHSSVAAEFEVLKNLRIVVNTGIQQNPEKDSNVHPAFLLGGIIYALTGNIDLDAGYKYGLTKPELNHTGLAGITFKF